MAGWAPRRVWRDSENLPLPGFDPRTVQSISSRYTDRAIRASHIFHIFPKMMGVQSVTHSSGTIVNRHRRHSGYPFRLYWAESVTYNLVEYVNWKWNWISKAVSRKNLLPAIDKRSHTSDNDELIFLRYYPVFIDNSYRRFGGETFCIHLQNEKVGKTLSSDVASYGKRFESSVPYLSATLSSYPYRLPAVS
jgi:hypothetical protein